MSKSSDADESAGKVFRSIIGFFGGPSVKSLTMADGENDYSIDQSSLDSFNSITEAVNNGSILPGGDFKKIIDFTSEANSSVKISLINQSPYYLVKTEESLDTGEWIENESPPEVIEPGAIVAWGTESDKESSSTQGIVKYRACGVFDNKVIDTKLNSEITWDSSENSENKIKFTWVNNETEGSENNQEKNFSLKKQDKSESKNKSSVADLIFEFKAE